MIWRKFLMTYNVSYTTAYNTSFCYLECIICNFKQSKEWWSTEARLQPPIFYIKSFFITWNCCISKYAVWIRYRYSSEFDMPYQELIHPFCRLESSIRAFTILSNLASFPFIVWQTIVSSIAMIFTFNYIHTLLF